jgi:hypothetical protein
MRRGRRFAGLLSGVMLVLLSGSCAPPLSELFIGAATDLSAPDLLDRMILSARREGVEVLRNQWNLSGIPGRPYELPGSFNIYTTDGSEPRVEIVLSGYSGEQEMVRRTAILTLVRGERRFLRMTLVNRCVNHFDCPEGRSCVEGRCVPVGINARLLPTYQPGMEGTLSCDSGTMFMNTSTRQPMPIVGAGACGEGERCREGTCYREEPSCLDGVRNGDETDVDCGGSCAACAGTRRCGEDGDCASNLCVSGWTPAGSLAAPRTDHTATLLGNGKVLVVGGSGLASTELYDPVANTWAPAAPLVAGRYGHTATLLGNGKVLVAGGYDGGSVIPNAELYDPATNAWEPAGALVGRYRHTATLLGTGQVLVAGGYDTSGGTTVIFRSAQLYDPAANTWDAVGPLMAPRYGHTATLLGDGQVLAVGGNNGTANVASSELYNPVTRAWVAANSQGLTAHAWHTATRLQDGNVLVVGGLGNAGASMRAELYDFAAKTWASVSFPATARAYHTATLLGTGQVLVAGGYLSPGAGPIESAELYDSAARRWAPTAALTARGDHTATLLENGRVLVAGGGAGGGVTLASAELYYRKVTCSEPGL